MAKTEVCPDCGKEMELVDTTISSVNTKRCSKGELTGNIYQCKCEAYWLDNFLSDKLERWTY